MKFDVYGRKLEILWKQDRWQILIAGSEGKKRIFTDIVIPASIKEHELIVYLSDLCHEWATTDHPNVSRLD